MRRRFNSELLVITLAIVNEVSVPVVVFSKVNGFERYREPEASFRSAVVQIYALRTPDGLRGILTAAHLRERWAESAGHLRGHVFREVDSERELLFERLWFLPATYKAIV